MRLLDLLRQLAATPREVNRCACHNDRPSKHTQQPALGAIALQTQHAHARSAAAATPGPRQALHWMQLPRQPMKHACTANHRDTQALRPGGRLVYSTCSLAAVENGVAVAKLLDKCPDATLALPRGIAAEGAAAAAQPGGEVAFTSSTDGAASSCVGLFDLGGEDWGGGGAASEPALRALGFEPAGGVGWVALPDAAGCGPIYVAALQKGTDCCGEG